MPELTVGQIDRIFERQIWLEQEILGDDEEYIYYSWGGQENFYEINLWKYLGMEKLFNLEASSKEILNPSGEMNHEKE